MSSRRLRYLPHVQRKEAKIARHKGGSEPVANAGDLLGGSDRVEHEDEFGGPDPEGREDVLGGPDREGWEDVLRLPKQV